MPNIEKEFFRRADLFVAGDRLGIDPFNDRRTDARPASIRGIINAFCAGILAADTPLMPQRLAGKVFGKLLRPERVRRTGGRLASLQGSLRVSLKRLRDHGGYYDLADSLEDVFDHLPWIKAAPGPFASKNFESSNAQAVIVGPGGVEERPDARIGVTILAPYTRMPDHRLPCPRAYMALSPFDFSTEGTGWTNARVGTVVFSPANEIVAYRCTTAPLLMIWCDIPNTGTYSTGTS